MVNLFRAEWIKATGNRWVAGCLVWIFPVAMIGFIVVMVPMVALFGPARESFSGTFRWTEQAIGAWTSMNNPFGRLLLLGFTAVMFAGEFQWNTWKNTVPRNGRVTLIVFKFVTLGMLVVFAFVLTSILAAIGVGLVVKIAGGSYGPSVSREVLSEFAGDYALEAALMFTSTVIAAGYAALAAIFTRSILGSILVAFAAVFLENLSVAGLMLIAFFLDAPSILQLYRATPGYNLLNVNAWVTADHALRLSVPYSDVDRVVLADGLAFSVVMLAAWVIGLVALSAYLFQKQDIT
jgi:ABC-type transport system involved in multi-copper enzyme maturation permease subunit